MAGRASGVKIGDDCGGSLIRPDGVAPNRMVGVSVSVIFPCTIKSKRRFLLALAHPGGPGKRAVKRLCVCVRACVCVIWLESVLLLIFLQYFDIDG